jgi:hypothetical protein
VRKWIGAWSVFAVGVLVAGNSLKISPTVQFYVAVPLAIVAGLVCLALVVEKP